MKIHEHHIKLLLTPDEFSQFFNYYSEGRLLGSAVDLETDLESYFEGVGVEDLESCFGAVVNSFCKNLIALSSHDLEQRLGFDLVISR